MTSEKTTGSDGSDPFDLAAGAPKIVGPLRPKPKFADRLSKRVLFVIFGFIGLLLAIFFFALDSMDRKKTTGAETVSTQPKQDTAKTSDGAVPSELLGESTDKLGVERKVAGSLVSPGIPAPAASDVIPGQQNAGRERAGIVPAMTPASGIPAAGSGGIPTNAQVGTHQMTPEQQAKAAEKAARAARMAQARSNGLVGKAFAGDSGTNPAGNSRMDELMALAKGAGNGGSMQQTSAPKGDSDQDTKLAFLKSAEKESINGYHPHTTQPALSKYEIKTGSFIPMTLEQNINSDLPGQVTARVTEDVYDSTTGCLLLMPAMSKAVGRYDSKVMLGQGRQLIVWNSVIFSDGSELNLAGMQGYDTSGAAGLDSEVDNHYWRLFGLTFGLSMISTGVQLSAPPPPAVAPGQPTPAPTAAQIMASSLAQSYGQLGAQILGKYIQVQPTLRNYAGERFTVMVPRTIVFPKTWRNRCKPGA